MTSKYNVVVIGAGPAGLSASIYLKRANINFILIESSAPGGQLNRSSKIENYPGFTEIDGPSLAYNMYKQALDLGVEIIFQQVIKINSKKEKKEIILPNQNIICDYIIIASGRRPKMLSLENEEKLLGNGISYCATCDGFFYKDKVVSVVGGGNTALEEALYLSPIAKKVYLINKNEKFKGEEVTIQKVKQVSNIKIITKQEIVKLNGTQRLESIKLKNNKILKTDGLFVAIGNIPNSEFIDFVEKENNYILVNQNFQTSDQNIYAVGDVTKKSTYQIVTAVSDGAIAANKIINELSKNIDF